MQGLGCLVIDLQENFLKVIPDRNELVNRVCFVVEACSLLNIPLYFSEQVPDKLGPTVSDIMDVAKDPFVFGKTTFSSWTDADFQERLNADEISHLLVCGIETPICVYQSIIDANRDDMHTTLLSDCVSCRRSNDATAVIQMLRSNKEFNFLPSETIFYSILQDAKHPAFRDFTKLVKKYSA